MANKIIQVPKAGQLVFGLDWSTLPGAAKQSIELKRLIKEWKASIVTVLQKPDGGAVIGLSTGKGIKGKAASAAALFSRQVGVANAMYVHQFEDGSCSLIGVLDGVPTPGYDRIGSRADIEQLAEKFSNLRVGLPIALYGNVEIGTTPISLSLDDLAIRNRRYFKDAALRSTKFPIKILLAILIVAIGASAGYVFYVKWQHEMQRKREAEQQVRNPNAWYQEALGPVLARAGYRANKTVSVYIEALDKLPQYHASWRLAEASCAPGSCLLTWKIEQGGSFGSFKNALLPYLKNVEYKPDLTTITSSIAFDMPAIAQGIRDADLPKQAAFGFEQDDNNQINRGLFPKLTLQAASNVVTLPPSIQESALAQVINVGNWDFKGYLYQDDILKSLPDSVTLETFSVVFAPGAFTLSVQGKYYVKK